MDRHPQGPEPTDPTVSELFSSARRAYRAQHLDADRADALWAQIQTDLAAPPEAARGPALWLAAAAVIFVGVGGALWLARGGGAPAVAVDPAPVAAAPSLPPGSVQTPTTLPGDARIEPIGGPVQVLEARPHRTRLAVRHAAVRSTVPPLPKDGQGYYVVQTPLADVAVRGTVFTVADGDDGATTVQVTEGLVQVTPRDGRPERLVPAGQSVILEPATSAGAARAEARADWSQAAWLWGQVARATADPLAAENLRLRAGRRLVEAPASVQADFWASALAAHPEGVHAEEFLFRRGEALHRAGQIEAARAAGERLRARFPRSPRSAETLRW